MLTKTSQGNIFLIFLHSFNQDNHERHSMPRRKKTCSQTQNTSPCNMIPRSSLLNTYLTLHTFLHLSSYTVYINNIQTNDSINLTSINLHQSFKHSTSAMIWSRPSTSYSPFHILLHHPPINFYIFKNTLHQKKCKKQRWLGHNRQKAHQLTFSRDLHFLFVTTSPSNSSNSQSFSTFFNSTSYITS